MGCHVSSFQLVLVYIFHCLQKFYKVYVHGFNCKLHYYVLLTIGMLDILRVYEINGRIIKDRKLSY